MDKLFISADVKEKDGKIEGVASTSVIDRQNESVNVDGWDLKNFKKNPVMLWGHDHHEPAIGRVTKINLEGEGKKRDLRFEAVFQEVTDKARAIKKLIEDGFIKTFSVGFRPLEVEGNEIIKQELLEISVVNVPANPEAMLLAYKSLKEDGFDNKTISDVLDKEFIRRFGEIEDRLNAVEEKTELAVKGLKHLNPQRSKREAINIRLTAAKVIARTADQLLQTEPEAKTVSHLKVIKRSSELLIKSNKGDLIG